MQLDERCITELLQDVERQRAEAIDFAEFMKMVRSKSSKSKSSVGRSKSGVGGSSRGPTLPGYQGRQCTGRAAAGTWSG